MNYRKLAHTIFLSFQGQSLFVPMQDEAKNCAETAVVKHQHIATTNQSFVRSSKQGKAIPGKYQGSVPFALNTG
jgi:hypothetical protein